MMVTFMATPYSPLAFLIGRELALNLETLCVRSIEERRRVLEAEKVITARGQEALDYYKQRSVALEQQKGLYSKNIEDHETQTKKIEQVKMDVKVRQPDSGWASFCTDTSTCIFNMMACCCTTGAAVEDGGMEGRAAEGDSDPQGSHQPTDQGTGDVST